MEEKKEKFEAEKPIDIIKARKTPQDALQEAQKEFSELGETSFAIRLTPQAARIIGNFRGDFPLEHFKKWWIEKRARVDGGTLHEYFATVEIPWKDLEEKREESVTKEKME